MREGEQFCIVVKNLPKTMTHVGLYSLVYKYKPIRVSKKKGSDKAYICFHSKDGADSLIFGMNGYKINEEEIHLEYEVSTPRISSDITMPLPRIEISKWEVSDLFRSYLYTDKLKNRIFDEIKKKFEGVYYYIQCHYFQNGDAYDKNVVKIEGLTENTSDEEIINFFGCEKYDKNKKQMFYSNPKKAYETRIKYNRKYIESFTKENELLYLKRVRKPVLLVFWTRAREKIPEYKAELNKTVIDILSRWKEYQKNVNLNGIIESKEKQIYLKKRMIQVQSKYSKDLDVALNVKVYDGIIKVSIGTFDKKDARKLLEYFKNEIDMSSDNISTKSVLGDVKTREKYLNRKYREKKEYEYNINIHFLASYCTENNESWVLVTGEQTSVDKFIKFEILNHAN